MQTSPQPLTPTGKPASKLRKGWAKIWAKLKSLRWGMLICATVYLIVAWFEAGHAVVILDSLDLPKSLVDTGLTSRVLTERVRERLGDIESATTPPYRDRFVAKADPPQDQLITSIGRKLPDILVPGLKQKLSFLVGALRPWRDTDPVYLSSDIIRDSSGDGVAVTCHLNLRSQPQISTSPRDLQKADAAALTQAIAECYSELANPYSLGLYFASEGRFADATSLTERMLSRSEDTDSVYVRAHLLRAIIAAGNHDYEGAEIQLGIAEKLAPSAWFVHNDAGYVYLLEHRPDRAEAELRIAMQSAPDICGPSSNLGASLYIQHKFNDARDVLEKAIAKGEPCATVHTNYGAVLVHDHKVDEAGREYKAATEVDRGSAATHSEYGFFLQSQSNQVGAVEEMRRAVTLSPNQAIYHANLSRLLQQQGDERGSNEEMQKALSLQPTSAISHEILGVILIDTNKRAEAEAEFMQAIKLDARYADAYYGLGYALALQHRPAEALKQFDEAIYLEPDSPIFHAQRGEVLYTVYKLDDSVREFEKALAIDPDTVQAQIGMAAVWLSRANGGAVAHAPRDTAPTVYRSDYCLNQASQLLDSALKLAPNDVDAVDLSAGLLTLRGQNDQALQTYQRAMDLDPSLAEPHYRAGNIYGLQQKYEAAVSEYKKAISIDPKFADAQIVLAQLYLKQGQYDQARNVLLAASQLDDSDGVMRYWMSQALFGLGQKQEAIKLLKEAVGIAPHVPEGHDLLAVMYQSVGDMVLARQERRTASVLRTEMSHQIQ